MGSRYFSDAEIGCHGDGCCDGGAYKVSPLLLEKLDQMREMIGGPIELSCAYRCPVHNKEVGGVANSQHVEGTAADVIIPDYEHCHTAEQLAWYAQEVGFDGIGIYPTLGFVHMDVRDGGNSPGYYRWTEDD